MTYILFIINLLSWLSTLFNSDEEETIDKGLLATIYSISTVASILIFFHQFTLHSLYGALLVFSSPFMVFLPQQGIQFLRKNIPKVQFKTSLKTFFALKNIGRIQKKLKDVQEQLQKLKYQFEQTQITLEKAFEASYTTHRPIQINSFKIQKISRQIHLNHDRSEKALFKITHQLDQSSKNKYT